MSDVINIQKSISRKKVPPKRDSEQVQLESFKIFHQRNGLIVLILWEMITGKKYNRAGDCSIIQQWSSLLKITFFLSSLLSVDFRVLWNNFCKNIFRWLVTCPHRERPAFFRSFCELVGKAEDMFASTGETEGAYRGASVSGCDRGPAHHAQALSWHRKAMTASARPCTVSS